MQPNLDKKVGHVLVVSYPLQGHAAPLMKLSQKLNDHGLKITFMATESIAPQLSSSSDHINIVSYHDGLESNDDRKDSRKLSESIYRSTRHHLKDFLDKTNGSDQMDIDNKVTCVLLDSPLASLLDIPKTMGIKSAIYWCSTPGCMALLFSIPKLIESNVIDTNGNLLKNEKIQLLPKMPAMSYKEFTWYFPNNLEAQKAMYQFVQSLPMQLKSTDWIICNWIQEIESSACGISPNILTVGPLRAKEQSAGSIYSEDYTCINWLDQQPPCSVVYVAFGSTSKFTQQQIHEIAMGLELMNKPFLWVAWSGLMEDGKPLTYPEGFSERVANRGKMVEWAPQEKVLSHPSISCFLSHCGWSSTMESISNGVPILCWPYFGDQMYTQTCICEAWRVGTNLNADENGMITRYEIKDKIESLLSDNLIKTNAKNLKEIAIKSINPGGSSYKNIEYFAEQMKQ